MRPKTECLLSRFGVPQDDENDVVALAGCPPRHRDDAPDVVRAAEFRLQPVDTILLLLGQRRGPRSFSAPRARTRTTL